MLKARNLVSGEFNGHLMQLSLVVTAFPLNLSVKTVVAVATIGNNSGVCLLKLSVLDGRIYLFTQR